MSTTHLFDSEDDRIQVYCSEDERTLWLRSQHDTVSLELTPRVIDKLEAAIAAARALPEAA